ncbi:MAG: uracil-DNA glycosylase [Gemmatimonadaceae bacterium]
MSDRDLELDALRAQLIQCRRCDRGDGVQPVVSLARSPRAMLVGQAPGKTEAGGGNPFAGRAGKTLFKWLWQAGIDEATARQRIYISAITRCYPGPSPSGRGDRVPTPVERANCSGWLEAELRLIKPALVIPVGRLAIDALIGPLPLDQVIGREFTRDARPGSVLVPLPHPSGASSWIHAPGHQALLNAALVRIARHWSAIASRRRAA